MRFGIKSKWNRHWLDRHTLGRGEWLFHRASLHTRNVRRWQRTQIGIAKLPGRRLENVDRVGGIEFDPFEREAILVVHCVDFFLSVDRRLAFNVVRVDGDKADLMLALDPANGFKMVSLLTGTPDIVMPPVNKASSVTHSPAPWG